MRANSARLPSFRLAAVPQMLEGGVECGPLLETSRDAVLLSVPGVARFLARRDGPVLVETAPGAADDDLLCFLHGPVAAAWALLRGQVVLQAASVAIRGRAVALAGPSGAGKSAVAAALALRGHPALADAVTTVSVGSRWEVAPLAPEPVLWPDVAEGLALSERLGRPLRPALSARAYRLAPAARPAPLSLVVVLRVDPLARHASTVSIEGGAKVERLLKAGWHRGLLAPLGRVDDYVAAVTRLAAVVSVVELRRPPRGAAPAALAERVENLAR
jgi:hypothetical protein